MRRFRSTQSDSLDLLLDTICNAFGGIVLIAILITLLTSDAREKLKEAATSADKELVERQIASLQADIKAAETYLERQALRVSVDPGLVARLDRAKASLQTSKDKNTQAWEAWKDGAAKAAGNDPEADKVLGQKVAVASRLAKLRTETNALDEKLERLKKRLETLRRERSDIVASKAEQLRLPKEQPERGGNVYFLLKNNEVYPLGFARFGGLVRNDDSLEWQAVDEDSHRVTPKAGRGISARNVPSSLRDTLALMKKEGKYATLSTDSRSAAVYRALRSELLKYGLLFGWEYEESPSEIFTTGPNGYKPPPL